jgi:hypothetical protein
MRRMIAVACVLAIISGGVWSQPSAAQAPPAARKKHAKMKKKDSTSKAKAVAVVPPAPVPAQIMPPIPATLMNSAPVDPKVTMQDGMLMIDAPNSTLSDVLNGVHNATGAVVEGAAPGERVAVRLGPGNPRQVIAALLQGTPYDYVILGSQEHRDAVTRIVLRQSSDGSSGQNASGPGGQPQAGMQPENNSAGMAADQSVQPAAEFEPDQAEPPLPQPQEPNQPKTPEQLFRELQPTDQPRPQP